MNSRLSVRAHIIRTVFNPSRATIAASCAAAMLLEVTSVRAETTNSSAADDLYYTFDDDVLDAVGNDAMGALLHIRPGAARTLLIRPRVQFVDELLVTIEQM